MERVGIAVRKIVFIFVTVVLCGCGAPISVRHLSPREAQLALTANVLTTGKLSGFSEIVLRKYDLLSSYNDDPEAALQTLREEVISRAGGLDELFALSELSYVHAEKTKKPEAKRSYHLAAAVYAYALLFPGEGGQTLEPIDPRTRIAADLYNRALAEAFKSKTGFDVDPASGVYELPFGHIEVAFDPETLGFRDGRFTDFMRSADYELKGLINRYRKPGIGAPVAPHLEIPADSVIAKHVSPYLRVPSTLLLRLDDPRSQIQTDSLRASFEFFPFSSDAAVKIEGSDVPLESETSAAFAAFLADSKFWKSEMARFLGRTLRIQERSVLNAMEPVRGRIPVVFVHGTNSSPARWADMANDLLNDPQIHSRFSFWFFSYMSSNPIAYSARSLRNQLVAAMDAADPSHVQPCLKEMVVIGHSQGGLLTKMSAIDSGDRFWRALSSKRFEDVPMSDETRRVIGESLFVKPLPFVTRVVFIATPHRGSFLAGPQIVRRLIERLVTLPTDVLRVSADLTGSLIGYRSTESKLSLQRIPTSIDNMSPGNPFIVELSKVPVAPGIAVNSIIPVKEGYDPYEDGNDGVVKYKSAQIEPVESELVVRSPHSTQSNPHTIEEVRRILLHHAAEANCGPPVDLSKPWSPNSSPANVY